jgi:hypothetical protein
MATNRPVTELDFDAIKADLINYIKSNQTYSDYNFEGSALNTIIDLLAYNTHNNAYYANMLHNEGFIDTAQKRSSVVSKAKELGYVPRSAVCSSAFVDITVIGAPTNLQPFSLSRGSNFGSINDNGAYTFLVEKNQISQLIGLNTYKFSNVKLVNGVSVRNYFKVDTISNLRSLFTIPNKNIDISTLQVFVRDSISSVELVEYFAVDNVYELTANSRNYFIQESYDGYFQIYFGNGVLGVQPIDGNIIDVDYMTVENYALADVCKTFTFNGSIANVTSTNILTTQVSFGGSDKETIASIRVNAVKSNSAKERAVTSSDYELTLKEKFNFIKSVAVWGGEDNVPPVYGKVFLSVQPISGYTISDTIKQNILLPAIKASSMITIIPEFVDPTYINVDFTTSIKFNTLKTLSSQAVMESLVKATVKNYLDSISSFNLDYLDSYLSGLIAATDPGIVSVDINKKVGFKLTPLINVETTFSKLLQNAVLPGSVTSNQFNIYTDSLHKVFIKEIASKVDIIINANTGVAETVQYLGLYTEDLILVKEIGYVNLNTGEFELTFSLYSYITDTRYVSLRCRLVNVDIEIFRNQILVMDSSVNELSTNTVITEIYGK